tara:strand:+ start:720 stop:932 length:213 start_codon:yes stop_codon:yes gene_type:complete
MYVEIFDGHSDVEMHDATEGNKRGELQNVVSSSLRGTAVLGQNKKESLSPFSVYCFYTFLTFLLCTFLKK